jgi:hypothetical protein
MEAGVGATSVPRSRPCGYAGIPKVSERYPNRTLPKHTSPRASQKPLFLLVFW